jgi:predicted MFS family arabinose efflux permease
MLTTTQGVIADDLEAYEYVTWFTSAYLVGMASIVPLTGRLSYIVSPRLLMLCATVITGIGTLISGLAPNLAEFLVGRVLGGVGAAGIASVSIILVVQLTSPKGRGLAIGWLNTAFTFGVAAGAVLAGALEPIIGWRALFWIQTPIAIVSGAGLFLSIPPSLSAHQPGTIKEQKSAWEKAMQVDYVGAVLLVISIVSLLYGLSTHQLSIAPILLSLAIFPIFLYQEIYRHPDPIIPVSILASRGALLCCIATLGYMMARWAVLFYTPIFGTAVRGWGPAKAGSILIPTNTGFALGSLLSGGVHIRRPGSWYAACLVIFAIFPITLSALAFVCTSTSPTWIVVLCTFANGLCAGAAVNYTLHHSMHLVLPEVRFIITSLLATFRGFAGTFGSAIGGGIFVRVLGQSLEEGFKSHGIEGKKELIRRLLGSPRVVQGLTGVEKDIAVAAYTKAVQTLFFAGVGLSIAMLVVQAGSGWTGPTANNTANEDINHEEADD